MRTALDTNVLSNLWSRQPGSDRIAPLLESLGLQGPLVICAAVFCELCAHPAMTESAVRAYLSERSIHIDYDLEPSIWNAAAAAFAAYAARKRRNRLQTSGRLLADFIVGAHAMHQADRLFTMDMNRYSTYFPDLQLVEPSIY